MLLVLCFQHGDGGVLIYHWQTEWSLTAWRGAVMKTYIQMNVSGINQALSSGLET